MRKCLACISLLLTLWCAVPVRAQQDSIRYPFSSGQQEQYAATVTASKGYISGICVLINENDTIKGAIVNEFGISALDFSYDVKADKVTLNHVIAMLDKWYIRGVLREDIRQLLSRVRKGIYSFDDEKYHIRYDLSPMNPSNNDNNDTEESTLPD